MALDLQDDEIMTVTEIMMEMNELARSTRNTPTALRDFGKRIQDRFYQAGFVVNVDLSAAGLLNPKTGRSFPPDVEIIARVEDPTNVKEFDHDRKRHAVLRSKEMGVKYDGYQGGVNQQRRITNLRRPDAK